MFSFKGKLFQDNSTYYTQQYMNKSWVLVIAGRSQLLTWSSALTTRLQHVTDDLHCYCIMKNLRAKRGVQSWKSSWVVRSYFLEVETNMNSLREEEISPMASIPSANKTNAKPWYKKQGSATAKYGDFWKAYAVGSSLAWAEAASWFGILEGLLLLLACAWHQAIHPSSPIPHTTVQTKQRVGREPIGLQNLASTEEDGSSGRSSGEALSRAG